MDEPDEPAGELFRLGLDGRGGIAAVPARAPARWTHYRLGPDGGSSLVAQRRLPADVAAALVVANARPRATALGRGVLVVLRGVNLNPGAEPEDMVSVRAWIENERIVTICLRPVAAVADVRTQLEHGAGPDRTAAVLTAIVHHIVERMRPVIDDLEETIDDLHERLLAGRLQQLPRDLAALRIDTVLLRRHMAPQRDALQDLARIDALGLTDRERDELQHATDRHLRHLEDLDSIRERATVLQDELDHHAAMRLNRGLYLLAVVTTIFMPLGLLTGLLGSNIGGIPGADWPYAFWVVGGLLVAIALAEIWLLRRRGLL